MIEAAFYSRSVSDATIAGLLGTKLYPIQAPQGTALPYAVYQMVSRIETDTNAMGSGFTISRIQLSAFGSTYDNAKAIRDAFRDRWRGYRGTVSADVIHACLFENEGDIYEDNVSGGEFPTVGVRIDLVFQHRENAPAQI